MRLTSDISDTERRSIIEPELNALFTGEHYGDLLAKSQNGNFSDTTAFMVPIAAFLARSARRVLYAQPEKLQALEQIKDRAAAGIRETKHISRVCVEAGVFEQFRIENNIGTLAVKTDRSPLKISIFGEAIFRDIGWLAGGVVRAMQAAGHDSDPAETLMQSPRLQRIGRIKEAETEGLRLRLGAPYISPKHIQLTSDTEVPIAAFSDTALEHIPVVRGQMGCPARRLISPTRNTTAFAVEWNDMTRYLVPPHARADGSITAVLGE